MILVDSSVWIDHLSRGDDHLMHLLNDARVVTHPFVVAEIMLGSLRRRETVLSMLTELPEVVVADPDEIVPFIRRWRLWGRGIGLVDVHLLAGACLTPGVRLWTRDKRLAGVAADLGVAALLH